MWILFGRDKKSKEELEGWNLDFEDKLVQYSARVVPPEVIYQKNAKVRGLQKGKEKKKGHYYR